MTEDFVLDRTENPHPKMLAEAWKLRERQGQDAYCFGMWQGFLRAMAAATGESEAALLMWMDRNREVTA